MTEDEKSGPQEGGEPLPTLPKESGQPTEAQDGKGTRMVDFGLPQIERGAALDVDEDAMAEAAKTSISMDGFETGAGFDLEGQPDEVGQDLEIEMMEIRSSAFDEVDFQQSEASDSTELAGEVPAVGTNLGGSDGGDPGIQSTADLTIEPTADLTIQPAADLTVPAQVDLTIPEDDEGSLLLQTPPAEKAGPKARHRGLEELERKRKRRARARWVIAAASTVLLFGGGGFAMAYLGVVEIPGYTPPDRSRFGAPTPVELPGPQPETAVMSHVVFVDTWREIQTPLAMADALQERMPDLLGFVSTLLIDGDRHYALMVGPAYNAAEANDLKVPLAEAFDLLNPDPDSWSVLDAPYSFFLGEYETVEEANGRVQELANLSVPTFVLQVTYAAEPGALRVYGGAFSDEVQARGMGRLLRENDLGDAPFTERRGRLPG